MQLLIRVCQKLNCFEDRTTKSTNGSHDPPKEYFLHIEENYYTKMELVPLFSKNLGRVWLAYTELQGDF